MVYGPTSQRLSSIFWSLHKEVSPVQCMDRKSGVSGFTFRQVVRPSDSICGLAELDLLSIVYDMDL